MKWIRYIRGLIVAVTMVFRADAGRLRNNRLPPSERAERERAVREAERQRAEHEAASN